MAHYAFLDENNYVVNVITGVDENIIQTDSDGQIIGGSTEAWEIFYENLPHFKNLRCKRTSYNNNYRKNYAGIGFFYDETRDAFIAPKPFASWLLNEATCRWQPPTPQPARDYYWDESSNNWIKN